MVNEFIKNHKILSVAMALILAGLVGFGVYVVISRIGKEPVAVYLVPDDATLTIAGERFSAGTAYIKPGTYRVVAKKDGFKDYQTSITITRNNTAAIDVALEPDSDAAREWQRQHMKLYLAQESRAGARANTEGEKFSQINPITSKLPFENLLYTIGYRADPADTSGNSIIIEIDSLPGFRNAALKKIRELGYDPTDLKINFRNYESPFDE